VSKEVIKIMGPYMKHKTRDGTLIKEVTTRLNDGASEELAREDLGTISPTERSMEYAFGDRDEFTEAVLKEILDGIRTVGNQGVTGKTMREQQAGPRCTECTAARHPEATFCGDCGTKFKGEFEEPCDHKNRTRQEKWTFCTHGECGQEELPGRKPGTFCARCGKDKRRHKDFCDECGQDRRTKEQEEEAREEDGCEWGIEDTKEADMMRMPPPRSRSGRGGERQHSDPEKHQICSAAGLRERSTRVGTEVTDSLMKVINITKEGWTTVRSGGFKGMTRRIVYHDIAQTPETGPGRLLPRTATLEDKSAIRTAEAQIRTQCLGEATEAYTHVTIMDTREKSSRTVITAQKHREQLITVLRGSLLIKNAGNDEITMQRGDTVTLPMMNLKTPTADRTYTLGTAKGGAAWIELRDIQEAHREICRRGSQCAYEVCAFTHYDRPEQGQGPL
jgi:hypothetical protein